MHESFVRHELQCMNDYDTYREGVEAFLAGCIPNLISQNTVLQSAFLGQERSSDSRFLIRLELI